MKTAVTTLAAALFAMSMIAGCSADSGEAGPDGDAVLDDENNDLTDAQRDDRRITTLRNKVADVNQEHVTFSSRTKSPLKNPSSGSRNDTTALFGVDWFQQWPGGVSADHGWENGTEIGKRCMWSAVLRFEAIMKEPPPELKAFVAEYTEWGGGFYNWVDDYSKPESQGDASGARLWAWRSGLSKWISAAAKDGSCFLPTRQMVIEYAAACKAHVARGGKMEGCSVR